MFFCVVGGIGTNHMRRPSYNAFEIISSLSNGFDLRNLFETRKRSPSMFISKLSASAVVGKLENVAKKLNLKVTGKKDFMVRMQGMTEGRKGRLGMTVEFSKSSGDTLEYVKFCEDEVRPSLKDIVWSWQGDSHSSC
ncbi:hypothetical protein KIW84_058386 [Lathyrus oleraceus]|uniref:NAF domain-containing protein n=1 Tax=Pisum sativum TaxID=3888 RepID=A0A9D4X8S4_PEA|nr:hypothetical protein KIW84_058386 [Pisum sativum]